jgi:hypothetical protein
MNDGLRTDIFLRYSPEIIACACIYLSARELQIPLPENPPWYTIFGADEASINAICIRILHLYTHETRPQEELEKIVTECREALERERLRVREAAASTTTNTSTTNGTTPAEAKTDKAPAEDPIKALLEKIKQNNAAKLAEAAKTTSRSELKASSQSNGHHHGSHLISRHSSFNYDVPPGMIPPPHHRHHPYPVVLPPGVHPYPNEDYYNYDMRYANENGYFEGAGLKRNKSASYMLDSSKDIELVTFFYLDFDQKDLI